MKCLLLFSLLIVFVIGSGCHSGKSKDQSTITSPEAALGWKLGAGTYTFNRFTFFEAIEKIDSCALKCVEIFPEHVIGGSIQDTMDYNMDTAVQTNVLKKLSDKGMTLIAYGVVTPKSDVA